MGFKDLVKKFRLNRLAYLGCCVGLMFTATGCANAEIVLTNATQDIESVGDRNLAVILMLERKGVISTHTATTYRTSIEAKKQELTAILGGHVDAEGEEREAAIRRLTNIQKDQLSTLKGALVGTIGLEEEDNRYGIHTGQNCSMCEDDMYYIEGYADAELKDGVSAYSDYTSYMGTPHGENATENAISFLNEGDLGPLLEELNRDIWVLKPGSITNQEQMFDCLNRIQQVKDNTDQGIEAANEQIGLVSKYFQPVEGLKVYNLEATYGNENSILAMSEDNSHYLGRVATPSMNQINKDLVVSAPVAFNKHYLDKDGNEKKDMEVSKSLGVYSFRILEFKKDFIESLNQEVFTKNQYVLVNPSPSDKQKDSNSTGIALLMEYPVMALSELSSTNANTGDWAFKCLDHESTGMRINIYSGEMLVKDENGDWVEANVPQNNTEPLYRVFPENLGFISSDKNKVSFMPSQESVTLTSGEIISDASGYNKVRLLRRQVGDEQNEEVLDDFDLDLTSIFPEPYLYREHHYIKKKSNGNYEVSEVGVGASSNMLELKATVYNHNNSLSREMNVHNWDDLWALYEKYAGEVKNRASKDFGAKEDFVLYKIYEQLQAEGKMPGSGNLDDVFTQAFIYNAFMYHFTEDDTNYLLASCGSEFDKHWDDVIQKDLNFEWIDPSEDTGSLQEYKCTLDLWQSNPTKKAEVQSALFGLDDGYGIICSDIAEYRGFNAVGMMYKDTYDLYKFEKVEQSVLADENCGKEIDLTDSNRDKLKYNSSGRLWEFKYDGKTYIVTPMAVNNQVTSATDITTMQFILMDYLELTYLPDVVDGEPFVATGRRIKFDKLKGSTDDTIGVYANKYGDPLLTGAGDPIYVKVSDLIDYSSGSDGYYEGIAKALSFNGLINEGRVTVEMNSPSKEKMRQVFEGENSGEEDTGLIQDTQLLPHTIYMTNIRPVMQFTSEADGDKPALDAMDVGNTQITPSMYYGICVNTNAYQTGLFTGWVDLQDEGGDNGSLIWWRNWLSNNKYQYGEKLQVDKLKKAMSGLYAVSLADVEGAIVFNTETLKVINKELNEEMEKETSSLLRTVQVIIGILFLVYGFFMMGAWLIDTNLVNGPGFLTIITFGRFVAIRDASEMPRMVDGKTYTDFKYLCVVTVFTTFLGIMLILFDIQDIWHVVDKLFSSVVDIFKGLLLNK